MDLREIEERVAAIEARPGVEYLGDLLLAYGLPRTSVSRLMSGAYDKADAADERLWKDKVTSATARARTRRCTCTLTPRTLTTASLGTGHDS